MEENIKHPVWYHEINNLSEWDKLTIYIDYFVESRALELKEKKEFYRDNFQEFKNHLVIHNIGDNWEKQGCAEKTTIWYLGIYKHYNDNKHRIKL